jgi:hypothetical protein
VTGQQTIIARGALSIFAGAVSVLACSSPRLQRLPGRQFDRLTSIAFAVTRLGLFCLVFFVLHLAARGDVPTFYWPEANHILEGLRPYRDFPSSYAPLHPYLDAIVIRIWHSPLAIILLAILAECSILPLWHSFSRTFLSEEESRNATLLYLTSAISLQFVTIDGQNTVIIGVLLSLALLLLSFRRELLSGVVTGLSIGAIKFLPLLFVPAFFLSIQKRWRWLVGAALPILAVYGTAVALHLSILTPLQREGNNKGAGNLPFLVESILGASLPSRLWDLLLLVVLAAIFLLAARTARNAAPETRLRVITFSMAALTIALLAFSKKSWPPYLMLTLFPLCLLIDRRRISLICFALVGVVAALEHSYWSSILSQPTSLVAHQGLFSGGASYLILFGLEVALLASYGWLLTLSVGKIASAGAARD